MIELRKIYKSYGKNDGIVHALNGVDIRIEDGEMVAIMGKSGSGKSTLLNVIGTMINFDNGEYIYDGEKLDASNTRKCTKIRRNDIGIVVQYFALAEDLNVYNNVALPLRYKGYSRKKIREAVKRVLDELGISDKINAYPCELSGGQKQRVAVARAIVKEPRMILADEPTGALDAATGEEVKKILKTLNEGGKTIIIVTHDEKVAEICNRVIHIKDGVIIDDIKQGVADENI